MAELRDQKEYEIAFLVSSESSVSEIVKIIKDHGGEIIAEGALRKIQLSYAIRKETSAFFGYFNVRLSPESVHNVRVAFELAPDIMRSLIMVKPYVKPKEGGDSRERRTSSEYASVAPATEGLPLSNEELEKKIDEILK